MRSFKSHAVGDMDEGEANTLSNLSGKRVASMFAGVNSKSKLESVDLRGQRHILKHGGNEGFKKIGGRLAIGARSSNLVSKKFKGKVDLAKIDTAKDWAVLLNNGGDAALLTYLANNSGVSMKDARAGKMNLDLFGTQIKDVEQFILWINTILTNAGAQYDSDGSLVGQVGEGTVRSAMGALGDGEGGSAAQQMTESS